jgi:hypothetical protein
MQISFLYEAAHKKTEILHRNHNHNRPPSRNLNYPFGTQGIWDTSGTSRVILYGQRSAAHRAFG